MSYSDPNRLDRAEALIEANSQQIAQLTQTTQFLTTAQLELARSIPQPLRGRGNKKVILLPVT